MGVPRKRAVALARHVGELEVGRSLGRRAPRGEEEGGQLLPACS